MVVLIGLLWRNASRLFALYNRVEATRWVIVLGAVTPAAMHTVLLLCVLYYFQRVWKTYPDGVAAIEQPRYHWWVRTIPICPSDDDLILRLILMRSIIDKECNPPVG